MHQVCDKDNFKPEKRKETSTLLIFLQYQHLDRKVSLQSQAMLSQKPQIHAISLI